jgi:diguanylate cyclase (GGDEF)-like protein/putative nucleotidyltransferase with HDIG domain
MTLYAKLYIATILACGAACLAEGAAAWNCRDPLHYLSILAITLAASTLKVAVPGMPTSLSVSFVFVLLSMIEFSYPESLLVGCMAVAVQSIWRKKQLKPVQLLFNLASLAIAIWVGHAIYRRIAFNGFLLPGIGLAATAYFLTNTISIAGVIALTGHGGLYKTWRESYFWLLPYYLAGGAMAAIVSMCNRRFGWETTAFAVPAVYVIFSSYRLYLGRLDSEKRHAEQMANLHLRTIEALALAIEAKDHTTHDHLQRVQVYALELGKAMKLDNDQLQALRAASILHDIGKLAVPEHIISKPGKLTREEFEKMKIHPVVGAEILDRVQFPYPVVPLVRGHHERWDGTGYPDGLKGEEIPLGARILATVDCLDALASDRQYRRGLPLDEAMSAIRAEKGKSYDPRIVEVLEEHYLEWERMTRAVEPLHLALSKDLKVENGKGPATGFQITGSSDSPEPDFLSSIAAARQEAQMLYELTQDLGSSLNLHETLSVLDSRLQRLIPYDAFAVYTREGDQLVPRYVRGENARLFSALRIPLGQGLSGWVGETGQPLINGNPSVEPGYLNDPTKFSTLRSTLAIPLESAAGITGVLALYHLKPDAFIKDHLRILLAVKPKVSLTVENALQFQQVAITATTDGLTGLPNARSLFLHLDTELTRCEATGDQLTVLVCDLDGFKQVNDRFGHLEGNRVLKIVASGLRGCCRECDYAARMGGDEFVLVLPGMRCQDLEITLPQIEKVVTDAGVMVCGEPLLGISIGAVSRPDHGSSAESLLAEADRRMYLAKRARRATPTSSQPLHRLAASLEEAGGKLPASASPQTVTFQKS